MQGATLPLLNNCLTILPSTAVKFGASLILGLYLLLVSYLSGKLLCGVNTSLQQHVQASKASTKNRLTTSSLRAKKDIAKLLRIHL